MQVFRTLPIEEDALIGSAGAFFLGLSTCTNVVYIFQVGNTPVYISYIVALALLIKMLITFPKGIIRAFESMDRSIWLFIFSALLSVVTSLFYCLTGATDQSFLIATIKGCVVLFSGVLIYIISCGSALVLRSLYRGLFLGVIFNVVFSFLQWKAFQDGSCFTLASFFPQTAFYVAVPWGSSYPADALPIYSARVQGLFLEASHLMAFLICFVPILFGSMCGAMAKVLLIFGTLFCVSNAMSANTVVFLVEVLLLLALAVHGGERRKTHDVVRFSHTTILVVVALTFAVILALALDSSLIGNMVTAAGNALSDLDVGNTGDTGTLQRWSSMTTALEVLLRYPFGTGWNTESLLLAQETGGVLLSSHSYLIRLMLELGPLGVVAFVYMVVRHVRFARHASDGNIGALSIAVVFMALVLFANGIALQPWCWVLLGIARGAKARAVWCAEAKETDVRA